MGMLQSDAQKKKKFDILMFYSLQTKAFETIWELNNKYPRKFVNNQLMCHHQPQKNKHVVI